MVIGYWLLVISYRLSVFSFQLSVFSFQLSVFSYQSISQIVQKSNCLQVHQSNCQSVAIWSTLPEDIRYEASAIINMHNEVTNNVSANERINVLFLLFSFINFASNGFEFSFYYKVSSENAYDWLSFYVDGELLDRWSGEQDWTRATFILPEGQHQLKWEYSKDAGASSGQDRAWVMPFTWWPAENGEISSCWSATISMCLPFVRHPTEGVESK